MIKKGFIKLVKNYLEKLNNLIEQDEDTESADEILEKFKNYGKIMEKINLVEILKNCPSGMELECASYDNVSFDKISDDKKAPYPIFCYITDEKGNRSGISFTENGCESKRYGAKCVIFPKGKNTWEGFVPTCKFKDGDIISMLVEGRLWYGIYKKEYNKDLYCYVSYSDTTGYIYDSYGGGIMGRISKITNIQLATEAEKQKLFSAIENNGYKWDSKTKTLNRLIKPKFKVGDTIVNDNYVVEITDIFIDDEAYGYKSRMGVIGGILFTEQDDWELIPNKFDITTLKPFDKVLTRCSSLEKWRIQFFEKFDKTCKFPFICMGYNKYKQCIPYEGNKHLLDTADSCSDYYRI